MRMHFVILRIVPDPCLSDPCDINHGYMKEKDYSVIILYAPVNLHLLDLTVQVWHVTRLQLFWYAWQY